MSNTPPTNRFQADLLDGPPSNPDAEKWVIASAMLDKSAAGIVVDKLQSPDFDDPAHRIIFDHIVKLHGEGKSADIKLLVQSLKSATGGDVRAYDDVGGASYLSRLLESHPTPAHAGYYADIVREASDKRSLWRLGLDLSSAAVNGKAPTELLDEFVGRLGDIDNDVKQQGGSQQASLVSIGELIEKYPRLRTPVIHGLIRQGETCNVISLPKMGKSWLVYSLLLSIVTGDRWLGTFRCEPGPVLLIDNELHRETIAHRIPVVANAMSIRLEEYHDQIDVVSLRGQLVDYEGLGSHYIERIEAGYYKAIIIDAHYRMLTPGVSENDNAAIAAIYNLIDQYAAKTDAAWFLIHHTSKGDQSEKNVTDVGSGAGSQSRAADSHLVLRPHEEEGHVVLDAAVRSWVPVEPVVLRWCFPLWLPSDLNPAKLKSNKTKGELRQEEKDLEAQGNVLDALSDALSEESETESKGWRTARELRGLASLSRDRLDRILDQLKGTGKIAEETVKKRGKSSKAYRLSRVANLASTPTPEDDRTRDAF